MDKLEQLYESYINSGLLSKDTTLEQFSSASDEIKRSLYNQAVGKIISSKTDFDTFKSAWGLKKKDELQPTSQEVATESITKEEEQPTLSDASKSKFDYREFLLKTEEEAKPFLEEALKGRDFSVEETGIGNALNVKDNVTGEVIEIDLRPAPIMGNTMEQQYEKLDMLFSPEYEKKRRSVDYNKLLEESGYLKANRRDGSYMTVTDEDLKEKIKDNHLFINEKGESVIKKSKDLSPELLTAINLYEEANKKRNTSVYAGNVDVNTRKDDEVIGSDDVPDEYLSSLGIDKDDYLKWVNKNRRNESVLYKSVKYLFTSDEGEEYFKEKKQYEKIKSYKASILNDIASDISVIDSRIKLSKDQTLKNKLKREREILQKEFLKNANQMNSAINLFPKYKEYTVDKDLERRKNLYYASRSGKKNNATAQSIELGKTVFSAIHNFATGLYSIAGEMPDELLFKAGFEDKGFFKGLSEVLTDASEAMDASFGPVQRRAVTQGKTVFYKNEEYIVDKNGSVLDSKTNVSVEGIISDDDIKEIRKRSKNIKDTDLNLTVGSGLQGTVQTLANLYALIRAGGKTTKALGLKGSKAGAYGMGIASYASSVTSSVEDIRSQLVESGMSEQEALDVSISAGNAIASLDGIFSGLAGSNAKLMGGLSGIKQEIINAAKTKGKEFSSKQFKDKAYELFKENAKEVFVEELPVLFSEKGINYLVNEHIGKEVLDDDINRGDIVETAILTIAATSTLGSTNLLSGNNRKDFIRGLAKDNNINLEATLNKMVLDEQITKDQAYNVYKEVSSMREADLKTSETIFMSENVEEAADLIKQKESLQEKAKDLDGSIKEDIDKKIASIDEQLKELREKDKESAKKELDAIQKQEARDIPDAEPAEGVQEVEEEVREPSIEEKKQEIEQRRQVELFNAPNEMLIAPMISDGKGGFIANPEIAKAREVKEKINAKYDAELKALESTETEVRVTPEQEAEVGYTAPETVEQRREENELLSAKEAEERGLEKVKGQRWVVVNKVTGKLVYAPVKSEAQAIIDNMDYDYGEGDMVSQQKLNEIRGVKPEQEAEVEIKTEPTTVEGAPDGTYLNVGMIEGKDGRELTEEEIESALPDGVEVLEKTRLEKGENVDEPTLSIKTSRPLTDAEMKAFREETGQLAIPQIVDGVGTMFGTTDWGPFNAEFFVMPDKAKLSDVAKPTTEGVSKLRDAFGRKAAGAMRVNTLKQKLAIEQQAEEAKKAIAKRYPNIEIEVFYNEADYHRAIGEADQSKGTYFNNKVYINLTRATETTVAHEVFHAILYSELKNNAQVQALMKRFVDSLSRSQDPALVAILAEEVAKIDRYKDVQNEEIMAELFGVLAGEYKRLRPQTKSLINRFLERVAKFLGLKKFTDAEVIDVLNTLAGKIATGQEVTAEDLSIINSKEISDRTVGMNRKQLQDLFLSDEKPNLKSTKDVAKFLDAWTKESAVFEDDVKNISDREIVDRFVDHLTLELHAWEKVRKDDYISFYDDDVVKNTNPTLQKYAKKEYGRELTDTEVKLYHLVSAFASPSANPEMDSWKGFDIFDRWMKTGELSGYSDKIATVWKTLPGGMRVDTGVPRVDEKGMPVRSKVTPAYSQTGLDKFNLLIEKMGGDIDKAMEWITSQHSYSEISDMFGYPEKGPKSMKENEYMTRDSGGLGVFGMTGAKLGSYILNRFGNFSTVTKDMWYARTMARLSGEDLISVNKKTGKEGAIKTPWSESTKEGRRMRSLADQAFKKVGDLFNTSPAMVQERIWDFEKRLYEMLGANEDAAYTSDGLKKGIERAKGSTSPRKQVSGRPSIDEVRNFARENNISEEDTNAYLKELGYTDKEISGGGITSTEIRERSEASIKAKKKKGASIATRTREKLLDRQARIKGLLKGINSKESKQAVAKIVTKAGATGYANFRFKEAEDKIYKGLSNEDSKILDEMIYESRIISINKNRADRGLDPYTGIEGYNEVSAQRDLDNKKRKLGDKKFKELKKRSDIYFTEFNKSLKRMFDSGLISEEVYNQLKDLDYSPIKTIKYIIPENSSSEEIDRVAISAGITRDAIKNLGDSNVNDIITDTKWLLATNLSMIEAKIFENRMLNAFEDAINSATETEKIALNEYILDNPVVGKYKDGRPKRKYDDKYDNINYTKVYYKKDGVDKYFVMKKIYAEQLLDVKMKQSQTSDVISKLTGTQILRFFATSGNPLFIVGNTAVDFNNILFLSDTYSNFKLLGGAELAYDFVKNSLGKVFASESYKKSYNEFMEHGGSIDYLSVDGLKALQNLDTGMKPIQKATDILKSYGKILSYLGETSEISFRIAVYEKSKSNQLKKLGRKPTDQEMEDIMFEATREARETIDFSQGGSATKAADKTLPYLNAATQGLRKGLDYANNNPAGFASSMLQAALMSGGLMAGSLMMLLSGLDDEDEIDEVLGRISEYEKANYHIIFTGNKDEDGEYEYYRVKKLPTISVFSTFAEQLVTKAVLKNRGIDYDLDGNVMEKSLKSAMPIIPTPNEFLQRNPLLSSVVTYTTNYDFFYDKPIFQGPRGKNIAPSAEGLYDPKVNQIYKDWGEATGMSPARSKAALEKIITSESTNPVVGLIYSGYDAAFKDDTAISEDFNKAKESLFKNITKKVKRKTNKNLKVYKERAEIEEQEMIIETDIYNKEQQIYRQIVSKHKNNEELTNNELKNIIKENFDKKDWKKYYRKYYIMNKKKDVDRGLLDILYEDTPEVQAVKLFKRFGNSLDADEYKELRKVSKAARRNLSKKAYRIYKDKYTK